MPFEQGLEIMDHELSGPTFCTPNGHTTLVRDALEDLEARRCHVKTLTKKKIEHLVQTGIASCWMTKKLWS